MLGGVKKALMEQVQNRKAQHRQVKMVASYAC